MANNLSFTISAVDKATAQVNRVNQSIARLTRPLTNLQRSLQKFGKVAGIDKVAKSLGKVEAQAKKVASAMGKVAAPLLAIVGGGTLAGVFELATAWARVGAETDRTSQILGLTSDKLSALRGAGRLAGISAETMTGAYKSFADTLQDARWGRNQQAFAMLQYLGIQLKTTKDGAINAEDAMVQFADRVQTTMARDPAAGRRLAAMFGVESLLPILMKGGAAMRAYQREAQRLTGITPGMTARANAFSEQMSKMGMATEGVKAAIGDKLLPLMQPLIQKWTEWLVANRGLIAQKVEAVVRRIADALEKVDLTALLNGLTSLIQDTASFADRVDRAVQSLGGWKTVLIAVGSVMALSFVAPLIGAVAQIGLLTVKLAAATAGMLRFGAAAKGASSAGGGWAKGVAGLALAGMPFAVDAAAGGLGVGGKAIDSERDSANWSRMTVWEKMQSGVARGIENVGSFLGMGNIANQARAGRIRNESAYLAAQGRSPVVKAIAEQNDTMRKKLDGLTVQPSGDMTRLLTSIDDGIKRLIDKIGNAAGMAGSAVGSFAANVSDLSGRTVERVKQWTKALHLGDIEKRYGLSPGLLSGVMAQESRGLNGLTSPAGARGLFQFMPATARRFGIDPNNPAQAADAAGRYLAYLKRMFGGNEQMALAGYNWGEGNVQRKGMGSLPAETAYYVPAVQKYQSIFSGTGGSAGGAQQQSVAPVTVNVRVDPQSGVKTVVNNGRTSKVVHTNPIYAGVG